MDKPLAIVIGGSGGIGKAFAENLGQYDIISTYRNNPIRGGVHLDLLKPKTYENLIGKLGERKINLLLNAAGIYSGTQLANLEDNEWIEVFKTNVFGFHNLFKRLHPNLDKESKIVFCGSDAALSHQGGHPLYSISKWALESYVDNLATEFPSHMYFLFEFGNIKTSFATHESASMDPTIAAQKAITYLLTKDKPLQSRVNRVFIGSNEELDFFLTDILERLERMRTFLPQDQKKVFSKVIGFFSDMVTE